MALGVSALAALGEVDRAKEWMNRALLIDPDNLLMRYNFACTLAAWFNDPDAALDMLAPALKQDAGALVRAARSGPDLANLGDDPRFQAVIAKTETRLAAEKPAEGAGA